MKNNEEPPTEVVTAAKLISASILVLAGALLIIGGAYLKHGDAQRFLFSGGGVVAFSGLICWLIGLTKR